MDWFIVFLLPFVIRTKKGKTAVVVQATSKMKKDVRTSQMINWDNQGLLFVWDLESSNPVAGNA